MWLGSCVAVLVVPGLGTSICQKKERERERKKERERERERERKRWTVFFFFFFFYGKKNTIWLLGFLESLIARQYIYFHLNRVSFLNNNNDILEKKNDRPGFCSP